MNCHHWLARTGLWNPRRRRLLAISYGLANLQSFVELLAYRSYAPGAASSVAKLASLAAHDANKARLSAANPCEDVV